MKTKLQTITETWNVRLWVTSDGMRHQYESGAESHQQTLDDLAVEKTITKKKMKFELFDELFYYDEWILVASEDIKEYVLRRFAARNNDGYYINGSYNGKAKDVQLGDWVISGKECSGDEDGRAVKKGLYTLRFVYDSVRKLMEKINSETVDGKY